MKYPLDITVRARKMRRVGFSIKEIAMSLGVAQSTISLWVRNTKLNAKAKDRLQERKIFGQRKALLVKRRKRNEAVRQLKQRVSQEIKDISFNKPLYKLLCSFLFWTEGGKYTDSFLYFINSEPKMVKTFMKLLRASFPLDEKKFRALVHIHNYHNDLQIKKYWSKITAIPLSQFSKSYNKPNTKKRIKEGYKGSIRIRYYDAKIASELRLFYNMFVEKLLGV